MERNQKNYLIVAIHFSALIYDSSAYYTAIGLISTTPNYSEAQDSPVNEKKKKMQYISHLATKCMMNAICEP